MTTSSSPSDGGHARSAFTVRMFCSTPGSIVSGPTPGTSKCTTNVAAAVRAPSASARVGRAGRRPRSCVPSRGRDQIARASRISFPFAGVVIRLHRHPVRAASGRRARRPMEHPIPARNRRPPRPTGSRSDRRAARRDRGSRTRMHLPVRVRQLQQLLARLHEVSATRTDFRAGSRPRWSHALFGDAGRGIARCGSAAPG